MKNIRIIAAAFITSGAIGLMYEVVWQRKLAVIFGTTLPAITAVLSAFMLGLAIGSLVFGRIADRLRNPVMLYGILELGVGLYCLIIPYIFDSIYALHLYFYRIFGDSIYIEILRFAMALIILSIPCSLMGGTLPVLSKALINQTAKLGRMVGLLYFLNTIGAVTGTLAAGFFFIPALGLNSTMYIAAGVNLLIGITFIVFSSPSQAEIMTASETVPVLRSLRSHWLLACYLLMGAVSMGSEIAWTRSLNLVIGSTVYAFTMMLAGFLLGIALGSVACSRWIDRYNPMHLLGAFSVVTGLCIALSIVIISRAPVLLLVLYPQLHSFFGLWQAWLFCLGLAVVFPATFFMGAIFPVISRAYISETSRIGQKVGDIYLVNTFGGIIGSITAAFVLIPLIGTRNSLILFSAVYIIVGFLMLLSIRSSGTFSWRILLLSTLCIIFLFVLPDWNPVLLDSGVYVYAPQLIRGFESNRRILYQNEGQHSYVTVSEKAGVRSLRINGKTDGSDGGDLITQILLADLPLLHHPDPRNALVIGLGTGVTMGSALKYTGLKVDCVEIDRSVIEASRFFNHVSGNPLASKSGRLIEADARTVLELNRNSYDVIISEPSNPWITGVSNLFTLEHFISCRNSLRPNGVICQWIHSYYLDTETLFTLFRTFGRVFPHCTLWNGSPGDYLILGSKDPICDLDPRNLWTADSEISSDLNRIGLASTADLASFQILDSNEFRTMTSKSGSTINTDNHPYIEFLAPRSLYQDTVQQNQKAITRYSQTSESRSTLSL